LAVETPKTLRQTRNTTNPEDSSLLFFKPSGFRTLIEIESLVGMMSDDKDKKRLLT
jgi:hypothetical protein